MSNQAYTQDGMWTNIVDGVATSSYWNLGRAHYPGLSCPFILPADAPDEPSRFIEWLLDPEYTLFEGCQCAAVSGGGRQESPGASRNSVGGGQSIGEGKGWLGGIANITSGTMGLGALTPSNCHGYPSIRRGQWPITRCPMA